jgi:hypothetical protein
MMSPDKVLLKIRELSSEYLVSRMPVRLAVLEQSLGLQRPELVSQLELLHADGLVFFDENYVLLSHKGFSVAE